MPTNKKPMLTILVEGEKRSQFAQLCSERGSTMARAVNAFIDRCLSEGSIDLAPTTSKELSQDVLKLQEAERLVPVQSESEPSPSGKPAISPERQKLIDEVEKLRALGTNPKIEAQIERAFAMLQD
jgi:antitoxin component of RelBE/YafQ-DinJ toxin-antitoxin module